MKRNLIFLIAAVVLGGTLLFTTCDDSGSESGPPIVVLGDSLSSGWNTVNTPGGTVDTLANAWPATFEQWVNVPVINVSRNGNTTTEALNDLSSKVLANDPQIVVVQLGANDFFKIDLSGDPMQAIAVGVVQIKTNLCSIIDQLDNGERKIYVSKWYNETVAVDWMGNNSLEALIPYVSALLPMFDDIYDSAIKKDDEPRSNVTLMAQDVWANNVWEDHRDWDRIHPTKEGCAVMAGTYFNAMKDYLEKAGLLSDEGIAKK